MSITDPISSPDATPFVERTHLMTGPRQQFREIPVNSVQAAATELRIDVAWALVEQGKSYFASYEDDGTGMTPYEMPGFLNRFGGSGRTIGISEDNFGVGFKTSTWPVNDAGVIVLSLRDEVLSMMWCWRDPLTGSLGARHLINPDDFDEYDDVIAESGSPSVLVLDSPHTSWDEIVIDGVDWTKVFPQWIRDAGHGTQFIMLGHDATADTFGRFGCFDSEDGSKYGALKEMSSRFWDLENLVVKYRSFPNFGNRHTWPTARPSDKVMWRTMTSTKTYVHESETVIASGTVEVPASIPATVGWVLFDPERVDRKGEKRDRGSQAGDRISYPFRAVLHESHKGVTEMMDVATGDAKSVAPFVGPRSVARYVGIVVRPHAESIFIDGSRTVLRYQPVLGESPRGMPWDEWADAFRDRLPSEIRALVDAHYAESTGGAEVTNDERQALAQRFGHYLRGIAKRLKPAPADKATTTGGLEVLPTSTGVTGGSIKRRRKGGNKPDNTTVVPGKNQPAREVDRSSDFPEPRWAAASEFDAGCGVRYDAKDHIVWLNRDHYFVEQTDAYVQEKYSDESVERVTRRIEQVRHAMLGNVMLGTAFAIANARRYPAQRDALLSEIALTALLGDIRGHVAVGMSDFGHVEQRRAS